MRRPLLALALSASALLLAVTPSASAQATCQQFVNPIFGSYANTYVVAGRAIDALGAPMAAARLRIALDQEDAHATVDAAADAFGVFYAYFTIKHVDPHGTLKVTLRGENGAPDAVNETHLDPFFRRSDVLLRYEGQWTTTCKNTELFPNRVSIQGRLVNRTSTYQLEGQSYDGVPFNGRVSLRWFDAAGEETCPPSSSGAEGGCDLISSDERGDFRYSFVFDNETPVTGYMQVRAFGRVFNATLDAPFRAALGHFELTGQGAPPIRDQETPMGAWLAPAALVAALLLRRRR